TANFLQRTAHLQDARVNAAVKTSGSDFILDLELKAGDSPEAEVRAALATGRNYIEHQGRVYLFDKDRLAKLAEAQRALSAMPQAGAAAHTSMRIPSSRVPEVQSILDELSPNFQPTDEWNERSRALRELTSLPPAPV